MALLEHIRAELAVLKQAPFTFVFLTIFGFLAGVKVGSWHYSEELTAKDGQLSRYRVALGIDPANKGVLIELNNQELAARALSTAAKLRDLSSEFDKRSAAVKQQKDSGKLTEKQAFEQELAVMKQVSNDFDRNLASDADNIRNELRTRLSSDAIAHIVRVPAFWSDGGKSIPITALFKDSGAAFFIRGLADEIEQMAKLLPSDAPRKP